MAFAIVNWLSILVAAVVAWLFGALYYGALAKPWVAAQGRTMEEFKAAKAGSFAATLPFILSFLAELVMAYVMYGLLAHIGMFSLRGGVISGVFCWFGFVLSTLAVNNAFSGRRPMLTVIDAGHWLGVLIIIGAIIGWFGN
jgi:hypothetical protein